MSVRYYLWLCYFPISAHCHATAQLFENAERIGFCPHVSDVVCSPKTYMFELVCAFPIIELIQNSACCFLEMGKKKKEEFCFS